MTPVLIALAGGIGALARFELASAVARRTRTISLPLGTLVVNAIGSFLAGFVFTASTGTTMTQVAATGFLGGFTTFSTWMTETSNLAEEGGSAGLALGNVAVMLAVGVAGAWLGMTLGS